jgi:peptide/nickel transport system permease protein
MKPLDRAEKDIEAEVLAVETQLRYRGWAAEVWRRFRHHPGAIGGSLVLTLVVLATILAFVSPYHPEKSDIGDRLQPPSREHLMGTDPLGRDLLTRVLYGGRVSLRVAAMAVMIVLVIGVPMGAIAGYFGGWIDNVLMRITDAALTLPSLLILILLSAIMLEVDIPFFKSNSPMTISLVIGILSWMTMARLVRASFLTIREKEFVMGARAVGASDWRIAVRHILPNALSPVIVECTLEMGYAIMQEAGLSFLGLGVQPPTPSWGNLIGKAQTHLSQHPWLAIFPGLMIFLTIISINYIGDGLRDALDPYKVLTEVGEV